MDFKEFFVRTHQGGILKHWSMSKENILKYWQVLSPNVPIQFSPMAPGKKGSTYGEDGIRITGSRRFIDSVLGRFKDILQYENPHTKLDLVYRQVQNKSTNMPDKLSSFVFYIQCKQRSNKKF